MGRSVGVCALCVAMFLAIGCGGGGSKTTQQLRIVMASPSTPRVDILINGSQVATSLAFGNFTGYIPVKASQQRIQVKTVSDSKTVLQQTVAVLPGGKQTLLVTGAESSGQSLVLTDGGTTTTTGFGNVRVVNASTTMGGADVYIVNAGAGLAGKTPATPNLTYNQTTGYKTQAIGNYEVYMTAPGTTNTYLDTGSLALAQSQYQTVVAVDGANGGFNYILLTDQ